MSLVNGRRCFLKGLTAAAGLCFSPRFLSAREVSPLPVLLATNASGKAFAAGAASLTRLQTYYVDALRPELWLTQLLQQYSGQRLIGLMDNAGFILFETLALSAGARFVAVGHHHRRHYFVTAAETGRVAAGVPRPPTVTPFGRQCGGMLHSMKESTPGRRKSSPVEEVANALALTGAYYAQLAAGASRPCIPGGVVAMRNADVPVSGKPLVSFVVAV